MFGKPAHLVGVLLVVVGPAVAHRPQRLAGERARHDRAVLGSLDELLLVARPGTRLGSRDETSSDPHAVGTQRQRSRETATVNDAARSDDRHAVSHGVDNLRDQRKRRDLSRVATGLGPLSDDEVASGVDRADGVTHLAAHAGDQHVVVMAQTDDLGRNTETRHEHRHAAGDGALGLRLELAGKGGQEIHAERCIRERADTVDLLDQFLGRHRRGAEAAEAARLRDGSGEFVVRDTAHPREHHGMVDLEKVGESCVQHAAHGSVKP